MKKLMVNAGCATRQKNTLKRIVAGFTTLAPSDYINRHNKVAGYIHRLICQLMGLQGTEMY
jgi:ribosomal protein S17E